MRSLGIDIQEISVISEKFQKFQINNTTYPKPRYRYRGNFSNFREISEILNKQYNNNTNYAKPRYRYSGNFSNFREISEILKKQYKLSEA